MRPSHIPVILCSTLVLTAATPWETFLQRHQGQDPRVARWTLCMRAEDFSAFSPLNDQVFLKLILGGDLNLESLGPLEAKALWASRSWEAKPRWILLAPDGEEAATAAGEPKGEPIAEAMRRAGGIPRFEALAAFLKEHPEQGEASLEAVGFAFRLMRNRLQALDRQGKIRVPAWHPEPNTLPASTFGRVSLPPGPEGEALADELYAEPAQALARLFSVPGWQRSASAVTAQLALWDLSQGFTMRNLFAQAASAVASSFRQDPYDYDLANFWMESKEAAGEPPALLGGAILAVPGQVWPPPPMLNRLAEPYRRRMNWEGLQQYLADLTPARPPEPLSVQAWDGYCRLQCAIRVQRGIALASQGSWDLAASSLDEARSWGGGGGIREALVMRGGQWGGSSADLGTWRNLLNHVLSKDGARPAMPALPPPLRLVVMGGPRWILDWSALHQSPDLSPWSPGELRWEAAPRQEHEKLRHRFNWAPGPRWALFAGEEVRATGQTCPSALALATTLEQEGPALLQRYQQVLDLQPDHTAAHRARFALLLRRMPDRRLEPTLARDAVAARIALDFDPGASWKPDPDIWAAAAQEVLPRVEEELRSWPSRSALWAVWISWARFHPAHPSILSLAQSLPYWFPRGDWRAGLPYQVQRAVAAELRRQGSFDAMRIWFRAAWEVLDKRPLAGLRFGERQWVAERRKEEETAIFQPLRDALRALGCTQEQLELERVFSAMMGREPGRR